jgi:hypothetical protein
VEVVDLQPITFYATVHHRVLAETKLVSDYRLIINKNLLQWIGQLLQRGVELFTYKPDTRLAFIQGFGYLGFIMHISSHKILQHTALKQLIDIIAAQKNELLLTIIFDIIFSEVQVQSKNIKDQDVDTQIEATLLATTNRIAVLVKALSKVLSKNFGRLLFLAYPDNTRSRNAQPSDYVGLAIKILDDIKDTLQNKLDTLDKLLKSDKPIQFDELLLLAEPSQSGEQIPLVELLKLAEPSQSGESSQSGDEPDLGGAIMDYNINANAKLHTKKKKLGSNKTKKSKNKKPKHKKPKHKKPKHKTKNTKNYKSFFNKTLKKY